MLKQYFEGKAWREISAQLVEKFKNESLEYTDKEGHATSTGYGQSRADSSKLCVFIGG